MNHSRVDFNILLPGNNRGTNQHKQVLDAQRSGKCHQIYGISDFNQNSRLGGLKYHEKYQQAYGKNHGVFKRKNGEFTDY